MTALQLMQDASRAGETQGRAVQVAAMGARRVGQALGSITHHKVKNYGDKAPAERRAALIGDYKQDAVAQTFDLQNKFIDRKYHRGANSCFLFPPPAAVALVARAFGARVQACLLQK